MKYLNKLLRLIGYNIYSLKDPSKSFSDITDVEFWEVYGKVKNHTMVSIPNLYALYSSVKYIINNKIPGDIVECGVWRGGCMMLVAILLKKYQVVHKKIYLYDTFEGMPAPGNNDIDVLKNKAIDYFNKFKLSENNSDWCYADLDSVMANMDSTGYPAHNICYIKGKVEDSLQENLPIDKLSLLRLDTDWYDSTIVELDLLYPILIDGGILFIDDYGHWQGARKATDEYFNQRNIKPLFFRVDYTCRLITKVSN